MSLNAAFVNSCKYFLSYYLRVLKSLLMGVEMSHKLLYTYCSEVIQQLLFLFKLQEKCQQGRSAREIRETPQPW